MPTAAAPEHEERAHPSAGYHEGLDGLRGVAVVLVLLYHGDVAAIGGGFLGVSVFFTLSGYLIASLLLDEQRSRGRIDLRAFWLRRARRLLPALAASLALAIGYTAVAGEPDQLVQLRGDVIASLTYVTNWRFIAAGQSYAQWFVAPSPVLHLWSLAIEEQFYLVFPPLFALALRRWHARRVAGVIFGCVLASTAAAALLHEPGLDTTRVYFGTDTRAAEVLVGVLLAMIVGLRPTPVGSLARRGIGAGGVVGAVLLGVLATTAGTTTPWLFHGGLLATALASSLLIMAVVHRAGPIAALLAWRPLRLIGLISYGTYLYHWPVFLWLDGTRTSLSPGPLLAARLAITAALALLSFVVLERPLRTARAGAPRRLPALALAAAALLLAGAAATSSGARPSLLVEAARGDDQPPALPSDDTPSSGPAGPGTSAPAATSTTTTVPSAVLTTAPLLRDPHAPPRIMVVGDSVATTLGKGLEAWANDTDEAIVWSTWRFGCGIPRGGEILFASGLDQIDPACDDWDSVWSGHLDRFDPDLVVVLSGVWDLTDRSHPRWDGLAHIGDPAYDAYLLEEYGGAVDLLSSRGATVVWLSAPCVGDRALPGPLTGTAAFDLERVIDLNRRILPALLAQHPATVRGIDLFGEVCPDDTYARSYAAVDLARPDGLHFERDGARAVADWLMPQLLDQPLASALISPATRP